MRDLQVWERSMSLVRSVYVLTALFPQSEMFGLTQQMRRAAVSVPSNIAEGHGRLTDRRIRKDAERITDGPRATVFPAPVVVFG